MLNILAVTLVSAKYTKHTFTKEKNLVLKKRTLRGLIKKIVCNIGH